MWNYAAMNIGFFIGFTTAGIFQLTESYFSLFIFASLGNVVTVVLCILNWKTIADLSTTLMNAPPDEFKKRFLCGIGILCGLVPVVWFLLQADWTEKLLKFICLLVALTLIYLTMIHKDQREKNNMKAYLILTLSSLVFWSLYQMAPSGLQLFAVNNVNLVAWGYTIAPQWIQDINTVVIVIGGPLLSALFVHLRAKGWNIDVPKQYAASRLFMGFGFLCLPVGILFADSQGLSPFFWLFLSYVLQTIGELLIMPVGYAMIGRMAPRQYQGIMMGSWMLVVGLASLYSGDFSGMIPEPSQGSALSTNADYSHLFSELGWSTVVVGVVLVVLIPYLRKLIKDKDQVESAQVEAA